MFKIKESGAEGVIRTLDESRVDRMSPTTTRSSAAR